MPDVASAVRLAIERKGTLYEAARCETTGAALAGRGPVYVVSLAGHDCVVRHCRRGGGAARLSSDQFLRGREPRPYHEIRASVEARSRGVRTPAVLAAVVYRGRLRYRADVATEQVPNSLDFASLLFGQPRPPDHELEDAAFAAGSLIRLAHERGVVHPDLNLKNVLLQRATEGWTAWLLDLDRCRVLDATSTRQRARMLMRMQRSRRKWERLTGVKVPALVRSAFRAGYALDPDLQRRA